MIHPGESSNRFSCAVVVRNLGPATGMFVSGVIDAETVPELRAAVLVVLKSRPRALVVDLTDVDFFAIAGVEVLVAARNAAPEIPVAVVDDGPVTRRPIELTGVGGVVSVYPTLAGALSAIDAARG